METAPDPVGRITALLSQVTARLSGAEDEDERAWLVENGPPELRDVVSRMSVQSLHLLDAVAEAGSLNVVGLATATAVPKGTVSKAVQRLADEGVLERFRLDGNRKEVHVRLTAAGVELQRAHRRLHEQMGDVVGDYLARLSPSDLEVIARVLDDVARMPREGLRWRPDLLD